MTGTGRPAIARLSFAVACGAMFAVLVSACGGAPTPRAAAEPPRALAGFRAGAASETTLPATSTPSATETPPATATPPATGTPPATPTVVPTITVAAVGDMLFDGAPKRLIAASGGRAPFTAVASRLNGADITLGNLECPLSHRGHAVGNKQFTFQGDPRGVQGLTWAGFDVVSLANNHARDYGPTALRDTFKYLKAGGIAWAGAGVDRASAWRPAILLRNGARIAYLAFSEIGPESFAAGTDSPGTAFVGSMKKVIAAIKAAHKNADYVIVSFHWGIERTYTPTSRQVSDGRAAVRAGADMVLSEHPHVLQGVEFYRHAVIAYSLGNFVFSPGSDAGRDTMILHATMTPDGVQSVSAEPCYIGHNGRPVPATGSTLKRILALIKKTCKGRGTHVRTSGGVAHLVP